MGGRVVSIDIGEGRVWARAPYLVAWVEMPAEYERALVAPVDVERDRRIRLLTPAEVERAERGLGPETPCPCGGAGCRGPADAELHQCGGPRESCGAHGCPECSTPAMGSATIGSRLMAAIGTALDRVAARCPTDVFPERGEGPETNSVTIYDASSVFITQEGETVWPATDGTERPMIDASPVASTSDNAIALGAARDAKAWSKYFEPDGIHPTQQGVYLAIGIWNERVAPRASTGLTPEQAARYQDATATTLRRLIAQASDELVIAWITHSAMAAALDSRNESALDAWSVARGVYDDLCTMLSRHVVWGFDPRTRDGDDADRRDRGEAHRRIVAALAGVRS